MSDLNTKLKELQQKRQWQKIVELVQERLKNAQGREQQTLLSFGGFANSQLARYDEALRLYMEWARLAPRSATARYCLGFVYAQKEAYEQAIAWYDQALELRPRYIVCLYRKGVALLKWGKARKAIPVFRAAIDAYAESREDVKRANQKYLVKATFELGKAYNATGQPHMAAKMFGWVLDHDKKGYIDPHHEHYNLGKAYLESGDYAEAERSLRRALEHAPDKEYIWERLGCVAHRQKRYQEALDRYQRALRCRYVPYVLVSRAETHVAMGNHDLAVKDLLEAVKRDRLGKHKIWIRLAEIALIQGKEHLAERDYRKAIEFKRRRYGKDCAEARYGLAKMYWQRGDLDAAREELRLAVLANPRLSWDRALFRAVHLPVPVHGLTFDEPFVTPETQEKR